MGDLKKRIALDDLYLANEKEKFDKQRKNRKALQEHHLGQINSKAAMERKFIDKEIECDKHQREVYAKEESEFQEYANEVITRAKERGANIFPLIKAARPGAGGVTDQSTKAA